MIPFHSRIERVKLSGFPAVQAKSTLENPGNRIGYLGAGRHGRRFVTSWRCSVVSGQGLICTYPQSGKGCDQHREKYYSNQKGSPHSHPIPPSTAFLLRDRSHIYEDQLYTGRTMAEEYRGRNQSKFMFFFFFSCLFFLLAFCLCFLMVISLKGFTFAPYINKSSDSTR